MFKLVVIFFTLFLVFGSCKELKKSDVSVSGESKESHPDFGNDVGFLKKYTDIILLEDSSGRTKIAISPALQGRVMTSTSGGDEGLSYGWINREAFLSGDTSDHMNAFGGEDRFWLGPEGGQFSIYFENGKDFTFENWHVPRLIDLEPFQIETTASAEIVFKKDAVLQNYSGTMFHLGIERKVRLLSSDEALQMLDIQNINDATLVAYESVNKLKNTGNEPWQKKSGLLSIWILGMYNPSENVTVIIPHNGKNKSLRDVVNDNYFGQVPDDRLKMDDNAVYFKCDGKYRSKIGLSPAMAREWMGSYDADNSVLTLVKYSKPKDVTDYVNSSWEIQKEPYRGDVINAYNDGPPEPGVKPMGPFYELESSSPAAALNPRDSIVHTHTTFHITGTPQQLDPVMLQILGVTTSEAAAVFTKTN